MVKLPIVVYLITVVNGLDARSTLLVTRGQSRSSICVFSLSLSHRRHCFYKISISAGHCLRAQNAKPITRQAKQKKKGMFIETICIQRQFVHVISF